ncbi:MAG: AIR synthase related protein [Candidatus Altiarchaeia archaeon]
MSGVKKTDLQGKYHSIIEKHVHSLAWMRDALLEMDSLIDPVMGVKSWDDAVVVSFGGKKLVASVDGPYAKRLVEKSALIHSATDVVVKGARPMFALDTLTGSEADIREMLFSLKEQALAMRIPILGGNTMVDPVAEPKCSLTVVGELIIDEPIRDCGACRGDVIALVGEPVWGSRLERIEKAQRLFCTWFKILEKGINIHASKDVTKGGLISAVHEVSEKSGRSFELSEEIPFSLTRNLDNFLICVSFEDSTKIAALCRDLGADFCVAGRIT